MHTILILEDHPMMVGPIKASVQGMPFKTKIHTASSLGELKIDLQPALIVADLNLPDSQGLKTLTWLRGQYPQAQILVFSQIDDPTIQAQVLALGACGYVSKSQPPKVFVERLHQALAQLKGATPSQSTNQELALDVVTSLTAQQRKVLVALASGKTSSEMALQLEISEATIRTHLTEIFLKLAVKNRSQAIVLYLNWASEHEG
jgi:DNA-binding NarL/FixJ family response regulator